METQTVMDAWRKALVDYFEKGIKRTCEPKLGVEIEHFLLEKASGIAVPYSGERGVRRILGRLMEFYPEAAVLPDDDFFGFSVPDFNITLEPASQLEISITAMESVSDIAKVYEAFSANLNALLSEYGYASYNYGCQPVSRVADLELIPKRRYHLMNAYFQQVGTGGMEMMRGTASLQVSIDYRSEEDFRRKLQAAQYYAPLLKLFCDYAPSFQGKELHTCLKRTDIWRRTDPARCGILPNVFSKTYGFSDYIDFLCAMPPIFLKQGDRILPTGFRTVAELFEGREISESEIPHILSMAFPDVRLKQFLEIRFADSVPLPFTLAYLSLLKGLLYSSEGLDFASEQIGRGELTETSVREAEDAVMEQGWTAAVYGHSAKDFARMLLALAGRNLPDQEQEYLDAFDAVITYDGIGNIPVEVRQAICRKEATEEETEA